MADRGALEAAAAAGVINAEQVGPLHDFLSSQQAGVKPALAGEEDLRFIAPYQPAGTHIVSALLTTGVAIGVIMNEFGLGAGALAASTLIVLGGFVLILGAGWHGVRRTLLGWVKPGGAWARIFPPEAPAAP